MLRRAQYCYGKLSVRASICPSMTLRYRDHIGLNSSKIISHLVSLGCSLFADPNLTDLPQVLESGLGMEKWLSTYKISDTVSVWAREHCRISPPCFLAECRKRRLNQASFVLLCVVFSGLCLVFIVCFWFVCCLYFQRIPTYSLFVLMCHKNLFTHWNAASTKVTIEDQQEVLYTLSIGAKINNLGWPWTRAP